MLGMADGWVAAAFLLCLLSSLLCIVYGVINWNRGGEEEAPTEADRRWASEEDKIKQEL